MRVLNILSQKLFSLALFIPVWHFASILHAETKLEAEFVAWAEQYEMLPATLATVGPNGKVLLTAGSGDVIDLPMPIASVSKTIAGQCALHMVRRGLLKLDSTTNDFLDWAGPQGDVTLAQLLTHSSGLGPDSTQKDTLGRNLKNHVRIEDIIRKVATRPRRLAEKPAYFYNNENYLVLEAIFAGGLEVSAPDLALFFHHLTFRTDWPIASISGSNEYGPGIIVQTTSEGRNLFHVGGVCVILGPKFGAFAAHLSSGNSVAALYSGCADGESLGRLNELILKYLGKT